MPQGIPNCRFFFRRAVGNNLVFLFRQVIIVSDGKAELAFGLGDLEAGDAEAEGIQDVGLDLIIGSPCLGSREVGVLQVEGHTDGHIRIFSDQLNTRLHMPGDNDLNVKSITKLIVI